MKIKGALITLILLAIILVCIWYVRFSSGIRGNKYVNREYGFELTLPDSWKNIEVEKFDGKTDVFAIYEFRLKTTDKNELFSDVPMMHLYVWKPWISEIFNPEKSGDVELGKTDKYVFTTNIYFPLRVPPDLKKALDDKAGVISSFELK